jgi:RimJ/RimL family protein N-acetyltransferase
LYEGTPKTREEVRAWILDCIEDESKRYFFVFRNDKLIGHIGLREINFKRKHADIGSFFPNKRDWDGRPMYDALKFIIEEARKLGLKLLAADFENEKDKKIALFNKSGFTPNPLAPHYLTLKL